VQQSLAYGRQAYLQRRISSEASIGKLFFSNGYKLMDNYGLFDAKDPALAERRLEMAQTLPRSAAAYRARARPRLPL
jgi:glycerol-3-phosphate O-acyltransferase